MFSPRDTAQRQQTEMLSFPERDLFAYLSSCSPRGQSSNLTHISRDQEGWWHHLHTLSLPHSRFLVSLGKEHMFGGPVFIAATQGTSLESLALVASRTYIHGSYRTATVFNHLLPSALAEDWSTWESQWVPSSHAPPRLAGSLRKELLHRYGVLTFVADIQRINFLFCLWACVQARACVHRFNEMIANRERVLNCIAPQGSEQTDRNTHLPVIPWKRCICIL